MLTFTECLSTSPLMLIECAISERLRRRGDIVLHPQLFNTPLIYSEKGRKALTEIYRSYRDVAESGKLPLLLCAPTWRIDREQAMCADSPDSIVADAINFMSRLVEGWRSPSLPVYTGALLAPKNDCYRADLSLSREESMAYHQWQIDKITACHDGVIIAQTMPALEEVLGMVALLGQTQNPYIISFVTDGKGTLLDGTPLWEAIQTIDNSIDTPPTGYMVNCVYPSSIQGEHLPSQLFERLIGIQANSSSKTHNELDGAMALQQDPLQDWGTRMIQLHTKQRVKILGGCCGTNDQYLQYLVDHMNS